MAEQVVILEPGGEKAQKIAKAMASQTACDILRLIGEGQKTSTEISERLSIPMNTAKYHIENLLDAGLIYVSATKYSVKGREVKVYSITNQLLIVAPSQSNVRSMLVKYASLFGMVLFGSLVLAILLPVLGLPGSSLAYGSGFAPRAPSQEAGMEYAKAASDTIAFTPSPVLDPVVAFFFGGALVIIVLVIYELYLWKKLK
jgi:DNA-binding transcriptional ArsR family regulator